MTAFEFIVPTLAVMVAVGGVWVLRRKAHQIDGGDAEPKSSIVRRQERKGRQPRKAETTPGDASADPHKA